jgi:hypothetical protein
MSLHMARRTDGSNLCMADDFAGGFRVFGRIPATDVNDGVKMPPFDPLANSCMGSTENSRLLRMLEERRTSFRARWAEPGYPRPRGSLPDPRPSAPAEQDTEAWVDTAQKLDGPVVARVLKSLHAKLEREEQRSQRARAKMSRLKGSSSLPSLRQTR